MELVTFLNPREGTMRNVLYFAGQEFPDINRVCFLEAGDISSNIDFQKLHDSVRSSVNKTCDFSVRHIEIDKLQSKVPEILAERIRLNGGREQVVVDMTNGLKKMSSVLYATASLLQIENLIFLSVEPDAYDKEPEEIEEGEYDLSQVRLLENHEQVNKVGFFEVFYYRDQMKKLVEKIDIQALNSTRLHSQMREDLLLAVERYFEGSYRETTQTIGVVAEDLVFELFDAISDRAQDDITARTPARSNPRKAATLLRSEFCEPLLGALADDPDGTASEQDEREGKELKDYQQELRSLATADSIFHQLQSLRNFASHPYNQDFQGQTEAKSALQSMLYLLEMIVESGVFK